MRGLIAIPTFENIMPETFKSVYDLNNHNSEKLDFEFVKGYDCARARNEIAKKAIEGNYDYVLMVDSDMYIPIDTLDRMLEYPADIILGMYPKKNTTSGLVEIFKPGQYNYVETYKYDELPPGDRISVKGGGFGCAFVKTDVFRRMTFPYFKYVIYDSGAVLSEDLYFCSEAGKLNIPIYMDTRIRCGHSAKYFQYE